MAYKDPREPFTRLTPEEARDLIGQNGVALIDVRNPDEFAGGHAPGATCIPVMSVFARREELPAEGKIVFICQVGQRSALACEMAAAAGIPEDRLFNVEGGTDAWIKAGLPVEK